MRAGSARQFRRDVACNVFAGSRRTASGRKRRSKLRLYETFLCVCAGCGFRIRWRRRRGPFVVAFLVGACDDRAGLQILFDQVLAAAARALLGNGLVGRSEFALRIISATVEGIALAGALFDQVPFFTLGAFHANVILLHVLALGISAASRELA